MKIKTLISALTATVLLTACAPPGFELVAKSTDSPLVRFHPPNGAERLFSPAQHNFRRAFAADNDPIRRGRRAERFELRDGDCGGSDCNNPRARAEIELDDAVGRRAIGRDTWFGWSFYNHSVPSFTKANSLRLVFGQWTKGGTGQPIIRLIQLGTDEGNFAGCDPTICDTRGSGDVVVQLKDIATQQGWSDAQNNGYVCRLFDMKDARGRWVDLVLQTNFAPGTDGYLRVWVDGELACDYAGPVVSIETMRNRRDIRHRRGIFSSWTKRWGRSEGGKPHPNLVVYYDEFKSGPVRSAVDVAFRQARKQEPVD